MEVAVEAPEVESIRSAPVAESKDAMKSIFKKLNDFKSNMASEFDKGAEDFRKGIKNLRSAAEKFYTNNKKSEYVFDKVSEIENMLFV